MNEENVPVETPQETATQEAPVEKTLPTKAERFATNPEEFYHQDEIIVAAIRSEHGIGIITNQCTRLEIEISLSRLTHKCYGVMNYLDMLAHKEASEKSIIKPPGYLKTPGSSAKNGRIIT